MRSASAVTLDEVFEETRIDPWFLAQIEEIVDIEKRWTRRSASSLDRGDALAEAQGLFRRAWPSCWAPTSMSCARTAHALGVRPVYKRVDTCAAEFATETAYMYSTYEEECEAAPTDAQEDHGAGRRAQPHRPGHRVRLLLRARGLRDARGRVRDHHGQLQPRDRVDRLRHQRPLYFEPLTLEDVLEIVDKEKPTGVIVQYGGQTPLKLAQGARGAPACRSSAPPPTASTSPKTASASRSCWSKLNLRQPPNRTARTEDQALRWPRRSAIRWWCVPATCWAAARWRSCTSSATSSATCARRSRFPTTAGAAGPFPRRRHRGRRRLHVRRHQVMIGGIMEHIEQAGVHSGDSACSLPPYSLSATMVAELKRQTEQMARALKVVGLMNVQFAIQNSTDGSDGTVFVLEVNPRASRTVPYVSKATGLQLAKIAARCMAGRTLAQQGIGAEVTPGYYSVKEAVFPFVKFPGVDTILGPEMKSTGEVMGVGYTFGEAFVKSQLAAGVKLPSSGTAFISVKNADKPGMVAISRALHEIGFKLVATKGTAAAIAAQGIPVTAINKVQEGRPHIVDMLKNGDISLVINTVEEKRGAIADSRSIRTTALAQRVTYYTTLAGARAAVEGMRHLNALDVYSLQQLHLSLA
jgi:carbamoyl-phosphate synthase large subunit